MKVFLSDRQTRNLSVPEGHDYALPFYAIDEAKQILAETEDFPGSDLCFQGDISYMNSAAHPDIAEILAEALAAFVADDCYCGQASILEVCD